MQHGVFLITMRKPRSVLSQAAPEYPAVGNPSLIGLIAEFEDALTAVLSESV
jgi:hypothetical protein